VVCDYSTGGVFWISISSDLPYCLFSEKYKTIIRSAGSKLKSITSDPKIVEEKKNIINPIPTAMFIIAKDIYI
jgi:hypothetical protein